MRRSGVSGLLRIIGTGLRAALKLSAKLRRHMSRMFPGIECFRHKRTLLLVPVLAYMGLHWRSFIPNCWPWLERIWRFIMPSYPSPNSLPRDEVESQESQVSVVVEPSDSLPREEVESQESLVSVVVEPSDSLPREEVESQESLVSVVVEPSDSLPREEVESQESLVSVVVEPESIPSGKVEVPVLRSFDIEDTDEYYCMYDSTWEDHPSEETSERRTKHSNKFNRFRSAARDMQKYRHDYPGQGSNLYFGGQQQDDMPNLQFYRGQIPSSPDGVFIEDFHNKWHRKYSKLEEVHSYIQWLFPLQEPGMNYQAKELTKKEIEAFLEDGTAKQRLVTSYKLMLDFYGIELSNDITGEVKLANNWRERFDNLERNTHNNLRITRILKCLGTLGFPHYQAPLVRFFLEQTLVKGKLYNVKESALNYFIFAVIDKQERRNLVKYAYAHYEPKHEFVWCPKTIQSIFRGETFPDDENPIDLKQDDIDDNTASYQSVSHDVNKNEPMDRSGMAGEVSDLMRVGSPNDAWLGHVSIPHDNVPDLSTRYTLRNKGTSQGTKSTGGRNQNTNGDSSHEDLPIRQNDIAQSSYGACDRGSSITTPYPSQHPTIDSPKQSDCQPSSGHSEGNTDDHSERITDDHSERITDDHSERITDDHSERITDDHSERITDDHSERITDDQRKRAADKTTEHELPKRINVSEGMTNADHDVRKNKGADSEPINDVSEGMTNADHDERKNKGADSEPINDVSEGMT
ncbi:opioid growth factor receptor-like protein 1 isoform X1 [Salmo salar]|uniref:Opioid growth factor receptor-like protein 1 isoform X1 n=3 Tax=Salmo salar TaxID=8030 RepID=A0ABM3DSG2_SALSA|nr:opioid growth factor receptor-like protein 1 isoform X1 [Salmo salar]